MATTAKAKAGKAKGPAKGAKTPKPPPKKKAKVPAKKRGRAPNGRGKKPEVQAAFLATVKTEFPGITADAFALQFNIPFEEVVRLRHFTHEYIKDFNEENAALRMGYPEPSARTVGKLLLGNAFTQLRVGEILDKMEAGNVVSGARVVAALWREANAPDVAFSSNSSTRIAALRALARIKGLDAPKPADPKDAGPAGGIMIVPIAVSPDQWGEYAAASQRNLKESTAIDV